MTRRAVLGQTLMMAYLLELRDQRVDLGADRARSSALDDSRSSCNQELHIHQSQNAGYGCYAVEGDLDLWQRRPRGAALSFEPATLLRFSALYSRQAIVGRVDPCALESDGISPTHPVKAAGFCRLPVSGSMVAFAVRRSFVGLRRLFCFTLLPPGARGQGQSLHVFGLISRRSILRDSLALRLTLYFSVLNLMVPGFSLHVPPALLILGIPRSPCASASVLPVTTIARLL